MTIRPQISTVCMPIRRLCRRADILLKSNIRYTKKDNEAMSETYLAAMKRQGFLK